MTRPANNRVTLPAVLFLLALAVYAPTLGHQFVYDDRALIEQNPLVTRLSAIPSLFVSDLWSGIGASRSADGAIEEAAGKQEYRRYRPLLMASYALNYAVDGVNPLGYHLVNVLLHAVVSVLLYLVALEVGWSQIGAFVASALFAVHPLHTEPVAWVAGRPEMMMAVGVLGALWCHLRGRQAGAVALFTLGLFSKEQAVVLPALVVLADACQGRIAWPGRAFWPAIFRRYGSYLLVLVLFLALRTAVLGGFQPAPYAFAENPLEHVEGAVWLLNVLKMAGHYLWLSLWPAALSIDYSYNALPLATTPLDPGVLWAGAAWGSLMGLGIWGWRRDRRMSSAVGLTVLSFLPVANLLMPVGSPIAERLFYLPLSGLCLLMGLLSEWISTVTGRPGRRLTRTMILGLGVAVVLALTARTIVRLQDWKTSEALFRSAVAVVPTSARAHFLLGSELLGKSEPKALVEGVKEFEGALNIYPDYVRGNAVFANNWGVTLMKLGRYEESRAALESAIAKRPGWADPYQHLGFVYMKLGQSEKAIETWRTDLTLAPDDMLVRLRLSRLLLQLGRYEEGLAEANAGLARDPEYASGHYNRGWALQGLGRLEEARAAFEHVLAMPGAPEIAKTEAQRRLLELPAPSTSRQG